MTRRFHYLPTLVAIALAACGAAPQNPAAAGRSIGPLHDHAAAPSTGVVTGIGEVRSIDLAADTITLTIVRGLASERSGTGRTERFHVSRQVQDQARVGEIIEYRFRPGTPLSEIVAINRHHHGAPIGLPTEPQAR